MASQQFASLTSSLYVFTPSEDSLPLFVDLDQSKYCCIMCGKLLREPMQTECGHRMCRVCVTEKLEKTEQKNDDGEKGFWCPAGEEDCAFITQAGINPDFSVIREINTLPVHCQYNERGCETQLPLRRYKGHIASCEFRPIKCKYRGLGCEEDISFKDQIDHETRCEYRPSQCPHCHQQIATKLLQDHIDTKCAEVLISCPQGCGQTGLRRAKLEDHLQSCPSVCKFYSMGCKEKGSAKHLQEHEKKDASKHLELVMVQMAQLKLENAKLRTVFEQVSEELDQARILLSTRNEEMEALKRQLSQLEQQLQKHTKAIQEQMSTLTVKMSDMERRIPSAESLNKDLTQLKQNQAEIDSSLRDLNTSTRSAATSSLPAAGLNELGSKLQAHEFQLDKISLRMQCVETTSYDGTLVWKISDYTRRYKDAVEQKVISLYSQPFYTSKFGYKMCARLYLNGDGVGRGTHLSLFFVVMKGEFDDILQWPFKQRVTMMMLNQKDLKRHLTDTFRPDLTSSSFQKPVNNLNVASGCPLFASHETLRSDDSYIRNDSIFIKIIVDTSDYIGT